MKKAKKAIYLGVVLVIAAMIFIPAGTMSVATNTNPNDDNNDDQVIIKPHKVVKPQIMKGETLKLELSSEKNLQQRKTLSANGDVQVTSEENDQLHPAIAASTDGNMLVLYENYVSMMEGDIMVASSSDGETWTSQGGFEILDLRETYPAIDIVSGEKAIGTWVPDPRDGTEGGMMYYADFADITDPTTWTLGQIDWGGSGYTNVQSASVAGYGLTEKPTEYFNGLFSYNIDVESTYTEDHSLTYQFYTDEEGYVSLIYWYGFDDDLYNISADIDQSNGMAYWVMEAYNETDPSIYRVRVMYVLIDPELGEDWWIGDVHEYYIVYIDESIHPDVASAGGIVYVVAEQIELGYNHNIICACSSDNGESWEVTSIASTGEQETNPSIVAYSGGIATCTFIKNGDLYASHTTDGGVTWTDPEKISDSPSVIEEHHASDIAQGGNVVWMDNRNGNADIYYDNVGIPGPLLNIESISGGFGVSATITNTGTLDATDVSWTIDLEGGLVIIGRHSEDTIPTIPAGEETTIKSGLVLGFGRVDITVTADGASATASGFMLGPLVLGVK